MTPKSAIAVATRQPDDQLAIGTAFLMRRSGLWLVSCAHIGQNRHPTPDWSTWASELSIFPTEASRCNMPMFAVANDVRTPTFRFRLQEDGFLADMIALRLIEEVVAPGGLLEHFCVIEPKTFQIAPALGEPLIGYGFPDRPELSSWPYYPADETAGTFARQNKAMFESLQPVQKGHSGGPVWSAEGKFVGMMIGTTDEYTRIVPAVVIAMLLQG